MTEKPILFKGEMVRATLEGRKTQTRRIMNPQPLDVRLESDWSVNGECPVRCFKFDPLTCGKIELYRPVCNNAGVKFTKNRFLNAHKWNDRYHKGDCRWTVGEVIGIAPHGQSGDHLWVKETFATGYGGIFYRADEGDRCKTISGAIVPWKPSIFCTRKASRINLEILSVRVERLQDISEEDAKAEGIEEPSFNDKEQEVFPYKAAYHNLWNSINGPDSWNQNPWVWVYTFKKL